MLCRYIVHSCQQYSLMKLCTNVTTKIHDTQRRLHLTDLTYLLESADLMHMDMTIHIELHLMKSNTFKSRNFFKKIKLISLLTINIDILWLKYSN